MSKVGYSSEAFWILFSGVFFIFWLTKLKRRHGIVPLKDDKKQTEKSHWLLRILALVNNLEILRDQRSGISDRFVIQEISSDNLKTAYYARSQKLEKGTTVTCLAQWNPHKNVAKEFEWGQRTYRHDGSFFFASVASEISVHIFQRVQINTSEAK